MHNSWAGIAYIALIMPFAMHTMDDTSGKTHIVSENQKQSRVPKLRFSDPAYEQNPNGLAILKMYSQLSPRAITPFIQTNSDAVNITFIKPVVTFFSSRHTKGNVHTRLRVEETCLIHEAIKQGNAPLIRHLVSRHDVNLAWKDSKERSLAVIALKELARHLHTQEQCARSAIAREIMEHVPLTPNELALLIIKAQNKKDKALKKQSVCAQEETRQSALFDTLMQTCDLTLLTQLNVKRWTAISSLETPFERLVAEQKQATLNSGYQSYKHPVADTPSTLWVGVTKKGTMRVKLSCVLSDAIHNCNFIHIENAYRKDLQWLNHEGKPLSIQALELAYKARTDLCSPEFRKARILMAQYLFREAPPSSVQWASYLMHLITKRRFDLLAACCKIRTLAGIRHLPFIAYLLIKGNDTAECLNALMQLIKRGASPLASCCYHRNAWLNAFEIAKKRRRKIPGLTGLLNQLNAPQERMASVESEDDMFRALSLTTPKREV